MEFFKIPWMCSDPDPHSRHELQNARHADLQYWQQRGIPAHESAYVTARGGADVFRRGWTITLLVPGNNLLVVALWRSGGYQSRAIAGISAAVPVLLFLVVRVRPDRWWGLVGVAHNDPSAMGLGELIRKMSRGQLIEA